MKLKISCSAAAFTCLAVLAVAAEYPRTTAPITIADPSFGGMPAITMNVPSGWKLEGTIMTSPCTSLPWPVFRSYSPDGLSEFRVMPVFGWKWAANPRYLMTGGCLPLTGRMTAAEFLNKYVELIPGGVHVVGPMAVDATFRERAQRFADQTNSGPNPMPALKPTTTADTAALRIETVNGTFVIEQRLRVQLECLERTNPQAGALQGGNCWARVDVARAPKGRLDSLVAVVDGQDLIRNTPTRQWMNAALARQQLQGQQAMAALQRQQAAASAMLKQQHDQFMSTMQRNHEAFMAQQESRFQSSMRNANASMNAQSTAASDWVDYALDQQTVTGQGGTVKISNSYTHTWSNGQNQWYQTNDPNANPNGVLGGTWTEDKRVHGNGTPY